MNVNPVTTPGPASNAQIATRTKSQQVPISGSDQVDRRQSPASTARETANPATGAKAEQVGPVIDDDQQKAEQLRSFISDNNMRLSTYHDKDSGRNILEIRDQATGDVVSQYPSEELIRLYAALRQPLIDQSA